MTVANETLGSWVACGYRVTVQRMGKDMKPTDDEEITQFLPLGNVLTKEGDPLIQPAKAKNADDEDPKPLGAEDEAEGNAVWTANEEIKFDKTLGGSIFSSSLVAAGVKPQLLNGYAPNLIGLIADWKQQTLKEAKDGKGGITALVVNSKILQFPNGTKASAGAASSGTAKTKKEEETPDADAGSGGDVGEIDPKVEAGAVACLNLISTAFAGQTVTRQKIGTKLMTLWVKAKVKPAEQTGVQELFANDAWFAEKAGDLEWKVKGDNVTIPKAAEE